MERYELRFFRRSAISLLSVIIIILALIVGFFLRNDFKLNSYPVKEKDVLIEQGQDPALQAILLLPDPSHIAQMKRIYGPSVFWILRETSVNLDNQPGVNRYESWFVNTDTKTVTPGQTRDRMSTLFVNTLKKDGRDVFEVHHEDPDWAEITDYYHANTGALIFSADWDHYWYYERGNTIDITKDGTTIQIFLAPPTDFQPDLKKQQACETHTVTVDALMVNGQKLPFKKPHRVEYVPFGINEIGEQPSCRWNYPNFGRVTFDDYHHKVYFNLPWNERVSVDIDHLDVTGVSID
jgi:hypothetical protein